MLFGLVMYPSTPVDGRDRPLIGELGALGAPARPVIWSDPQVRWLDFDALVLRSCWDYHHRPDEFRGWLDRVDRDGVALWNPASTVRWNMHKRYLHESPPEPCSCRTPSGCARATTSRSPPCSTCMAGRRRS